MKESYIESYLVRKVKEHGGLCYKFVSPGNPGAVSYTHLDGEPLSGQASAASDFAGLGGTPAATPAYGAAMPATPGDVYKRQAFSTDPSRKAV